MGRKKVTAQQEIENLNRRATEAQQALRRAHIRTAMANRPSCIDPLYEKLMSLGYTPEKIQVKEEAPASFQKQAVLDRRASQQAPKDQETLKMELDGSVSDDEEFQDVPIEPLPAKVAVVSDFSGLQFRDRLLPAIERQAWSGANLRAIKDKENV